MPKLLEELITSQGVLEHSFKKRLVQEAHFTTLKLASVEKQLEMQRQMNVGDALAQDSPVMRRSQILDTSPEATLSRSRSSPVTFPGKVHETWDHTPWRPLAHDNVFADRVEKIHDKKFAMGRLGVSTHRNMHPVSHPGNDFRNPTLSRHDAAATPNMRSRHDLLHPATPSAALPRRQSFDETQEDNLEFDLLSLQHEAASASGFHRRPADSPEVVKRHGDLMFRLGPRYKTMAKERMRDRTTKPAASRFQRQEQRLQELTGVTKDLVGEVIGKDKDSAIEAIGPDPEGPARVAWLQARSKGRHENQAALEAALRVCAPGSTAPGFRDLSMR